MSGYAGSAVRQGYQRKQKQYLDEQAAAMAEADARAKADAERMAKEQKDFYDRLTESFGLMTEGMQESLAQAEEEARKAAEEQAAKEKKAKADQEAALKSRGRRMRANIFTSEEGVLGAPTAARTRVFAT